MLIASVVLGDSGMVYFPVNKFATTIMLQF